MKCGTCKDSLVYLELSVADHQCDVTEGGTFKEKTELVTESTGGNLDWSDARLTCHVYRLTNHTYLHTQTDIKNIPFMMNIYVK